MKISTFLALLALATICSLKASSQNVSLNLLTQNSGLVSVGGNVFLEVSVCNTDATLSVPVYKLRPQISVPAAIASIPSTGHQLPTGWNIVSNTGSVVRLTNGTDQIPANTCRTILVQVQGNSLGGPSTISGNMLFSNGSAPGSASGSATPGDNPSDNSSTSTIEVVTTTPVELSKFNVSIQQCKPVLNWQTRFEQNSYSFEIQRNNSTSERIWESIGSIAAVGNSNSLRTYSFTDNSLFNVNEKVQYRLKMIDRDGRFTYSNIVVQTLRCGPRFINIYPNPVQDNWLQINLSGVDNHTEVRLLNLQGQLLRTLRLKNGVSTIEVGNLPSGTYFLHLMDETGSGVRKAFMIGR